MKLVIVKARGDHKPGAELDLAPAEAGVLIADGIAITASEHETNLRAEATVKATRAANKTRYETAIKASVAEKKRLGIIPAADTQVEATALGRLAKFDSASQEQQEEVYEVVRATIDGLTSDAQDRLAQRITKANGSNGGGFEAGEIQFQGVDIKDAAKEYLRCSDPMTGLVRAGDFKETLKLSRERSLVMREHLLKPVQAGGDYLLRDLVRAADYTDPNSQVGTLATGLILMRNLGYLKNKLAWLPYFSTNLSAEPIMFGHPVITRYITPPNVLTYIPGVGFTSDATTISNASATNAQAGIATQTSGTRTPSVPSAVDVPVTVDQFKGTELEFPITTMAATVRNLFAEQRGAQTYSLAEHINDFVFAKIFGTSWTGTITGIQLGAQFGLPNMVTLKNRMTLAKIPDVGRFAVMHSTYHDNLLVDGNLLTTKAILALINKDASALEQSEVPPLFGIKPLEAQRCSYNNGTFAAPNITADGGNVDFSGVNQIGFAGNASSMLFASRVPQDFTKAANELGIPATHAVEIATEPDSGLSVMLFKHVDNGRMSIRHLVCLMYGAAPGDKRVGIVLRP